VDKSVTEKTFKFAEQNDLPFYFVSAADGTNVVKVFNEALKLALHNKLNPPDSFMNDVLEFLNEVNTFSS
jgi:Rab-like protein 2